MINREYLLNEYGMGGEELKIEDKMKTLDKEELRDFVNYCAINRVFPSDTSLKGWILRLEELARLRNTAEWLCKNNLFGDVYSLLEILQRLLNEHNPSCDQEDYDKYCKHSQTIGLLESWFQEYLRK